MAEPWSVRRARYAGEALRPPRKTTSEDHDDDAFPASRDERSAERSRRAASAAPAPRLGPILALVTRRDRVQHVYCKRTNETVPCVAIRLADDTFDGLRVVLWRAHAAADVGAEHTRAAIVGTPHSSKRRSTEKNAVVRTDVSAARDVLSFTRKRESTHPSPLTDSFLPHTLDDWNTRKTAGVGDVLEAVGLRARWNAYHDEPELASGYGASLVVRATASALLYAQLVSPQSHEEDSRDGDDANPLAAAPVIRDERSASRRSASRTVCVSYGGERTESRTTHTTHTKHESRACAVEAWALEHRASLVRAAALADARRVHRRGRSSGRFGNAPESSPRSAFVSVTERVTPRCATLNATPNATPNAAARECVWSPKLSFGEVSAADLRAAAESSGRAPCFSGRVVDARAAASRGRRESDGGATKRVTAWVAQDSSGACTEVTLRPMAADDAEALARRLPGRAARFTNFLVFERGPDARGLRARRAYALVQPDDTSCSNAHTDITDIQTTPVVTRVVAYSAWCVLPENDARAEDLEARRVAPRRASAEAPSLASLADFASVALPLRSPLPSSRRDANHRAFAFASSGTSDASDASVVVVRARVAWVRLPQPPSAERTVFFSLQNRKNFARRFKSARGVPATRAEVAASLVVPGCVLCLRELAPDPADETDETLRLFRQCVCHSGRANAVGWVWRALELGLVDADEEGAEVAEVAEVARRTTDEDGSRDSRDSRVISLQKVRVARVDASLVSRLLLGASAAAAAAAARDEASEDERGGEAKKSFSRKRMRRNADDEVDHLSLATAAINALAAGPARNATPFEWHLRAPPPDSNGVRFADGAPLEVVDFVAAGKAA